MADLYLGDYTDLYGDETTTGSSVIDMVVTPYTGRPTAQIILTNNDSVGHYIELFRSRGVANQLALRYGSRVHIDAGASLTIIDDEAPLGIDFTYQLFFDRPGLGSDAYLFAMSSQSIKFSGAWTVSGVAASWAWLRHLTLPNLSLPVIINSLPEEDQSGNYGVHVPLGASLPIVTSTKRSGRTGTVTLLTLDLYDAQKLRELLSDGTPLQLATEPMFGVDEGGMYLAVTDVKRSRTSDDGKSTERLHALSFIEVSCPPVAGDQGSIVTYADLMSNYATYGDLLITARTNGWKYRDLFTQAVTP